MQRRFVGRLYGSTKARPKGDWRGSKQGKVESKEVRVVSGFPGTPIHPARGRLAKPGRVMISKRRVAFNLALLGGFLTGYAGSLDGSAAAAARLPRAKGGLESITRIASNWPINSPQTPKVSPFFLFTIRQVPNSCTSPSHQLPSHHLTP